MNTDKEIVLENHINRARAFFDANSASATLHGPAHPLVVALAKEFDKDEDEKIAWGYWFEKNIIRLLRNIGASEGQCKGCGLDIWWLKMAKSGKLAPITQQALNHFANCPKAKDFKKEKTANEK